MTPRTLKELTAIATKLKLELFYEEDYSGLRSRPKSGESYNEPWDKYNAVLIGFHESTSTFSCGVPEFGEFKLDKKFDKYWPIVLEYYIQKSDTKFFMCSTLTTPGWKGLNEALASTGFEERVRLKPNGRGRYKIIVWEYIRQKKMRRSGK